MVDGSRTPKHENTISSPCELDGSGELKLCFLFGLRFYVPVNNFSVMTGRFPGLDQY